MAVFQLGSTGGDTSIARGTEFIPAGNATYDVFIFNQTSSTVDVELALATGTNLAFADLSASDAGQAASIAHNQTVVSNATQASKALSLKDLQPGTTFHTRVTRSGTGGSASGSVTARHGTVAQLNQQVWVVTGL